MYEGLFCLAPRPPHFFLLDEGLEYGLVEPFPAYGFTSLVSHNENLNSPKQSKAHEHAQLLYLYGAGDTAAAAAAAAVAAEAAEAFAATAAAALQAAVAVARAAAAQAAVRAPGAELAPAAVAAVAEHRPGLAPSGWRYTDTH